MILAIRTDNPQAELHLLSQNGEKLEEIVWQAHRELSATIHKNIKTLLEKNNTPLDSLSAIIFYEGPGSFTGLRIGCSVANALGYSYNIPVIAVSSDNWLVKGLSDLKNIKKLDRIFNPITPYYGAEAHITKPKK